PPPNRVGTALLDGLFRHGSLWPYLQTTFVEAIGGCVVGAAMALPLAVFITHSRLVSAAVTPYLGATQAIPAIALAPLLVLWVGYGWSGVVALCSLMVFFPILVSTVVGLRHIDPRVLDAASLDGAGAWARLWHMELPLAGATILAGVRNGFTLSVTGAVVGEMVMGGDGLGLLLTVQRDRSDPAGMIASIVVLAALASTIYSLLVLIERRLFVVEQRRR
ncbi:MAG: ABC transporter permease subunit, partial [Propionibacteriaceae bacterium]|nr:ABC transporter permease subunit [Propionibacteriaceae bacterium]